MVFNLLTREQTRDGDFGLMPVGENDRMIGATSDRDMVVRAIAEHKGPDTPVREVMFNEILWAYENDSVEKATKMMSEHQVRRLPIVNADKRLVGIVALGDIAIEAADTKPAGRVLTGISQPG